MARICRSTSHRCETIFFTHTDLNSAADCRDRITEQLRGALGGAVDSPIATAADIGSLEQGSRVERTLADLVTTVEDLAREVTRRGRRGSGEVVPEAAADLMACFRLLHTEARRLNDPRLSHLVGELRMPVEYVAEQILESSPSLVQRSELRYEEELIDIEAFEEASSSSAAPRPRRTPVRKKRPKPAATDAEPSPPGRSTRKKTSG
jgi:hypothetical protein